MAGARWAPHTINEQWTMNYWLWLLANQLYWPSAHGKWTCGRGKRVDCRFLPFYELMITLYLHLFCLTAIVSSGSL